MFLDYFLITLGVALGVLSVVEIVYLIISEKQSKTYRQIIEQETETLDVYAETAKSMKISVTRKETEVLNHPKNGSTLKTTKPLKETAEDNNFSYHGGTMTKFTGDYPMEISKGGIFTGAEYTAIGDFQISDAVLEKYTIIDVISGGGMSKTFLALNKKLQNKWFIKFITNEYGSLASEENILKLLNHTNLPIIADVFYERNGVYLVQRYIEGFSLEDVLKSVNRLGQTQVLQWFEQITQVLQYLHNIKPKPIIHCDLKPANIMVTHDNNLVLIDFGISKFQDGSNSDPLALTLGYAAPEQFRFDNPKYAKLVKDRFGVLPKEHKNWSIDERTDIFSLGTIFYQLVTGQTPSVENRHLLKKKTGAQLAEIIEKCLEIDTQKRYQNTGALLADIQKQKSMHILMAKKLTMRRVIFVTTFVTALISSGSLASGAYIMQQENLAVIEIDPNSLILSEQESAEIIITKEMKNGKEANIDLNSVQWTFSNNNVRIDGNRIAALNEGQAAVKGRYRNKLIEFEVNVIKPVNGLVNVSMKYKKGNNVTVFAGNGELAHEDGYLRDASFISPESISVAGNGDIYLTDAGLLRKIENGEVKTIELEPDYMRARKVRCAGEDVYVLTSPWQDEDNQNYFAIIKLSGQEAEVVYYADADFVMINDFVVSDDGIVYALEYLTISDTVFLKRISAESDDTEILTELEKTTTGIDINGDVIYLAGGESGVIMSYRLSDNTLTYLAGTKGERHFIDGTAPLFYQPNKIKSIGDCLYILDFNVLRKINLADGLCQSVETVAGEVSTDSNPVTIEGESSEVTLAHSILMEFDLTPDSRLVLSDPKKSLLRLVDGNIYTADSELTKPDEYTVGSKKFNSAGYINIPYFYDKTYEQTKQALEEMTNGGVKNIIIDLRNNSGGILDEAIKTANLFVPEGIICSVELKDSASKQYYADEKNMDLDVVILVNAFTASSAEMFAAALSESGSGILLGTATYGKSSIQIVSDAEDGKTTVGKYLTRNGNDLGQKPLKPEIEVLKLPDTDNQLERALEKFDSFIIGGER